ncbi:hypothetical protein ABDD95_20515 [Mucilaginibacter sp. PAMB04274]|uniref:hypothetical protein n=1 Tax=Mucilaginibacter sp. PAMB04274 TaxID=3138568 RepID=UPI0031F6AA59
MAVIISPDLSLNIWYENTALVHALWNWMIRQIVRVLLDLGGNLILPESTA